MIGEKPKISVIVPVYKVEKTLHKCIDSIINQTYANLEIILVDDGSPDKCGKICEEYAKKDTRIRVIHQKNMGLSMARNNGMDIATGDYIGFVDSDDYIEPKMYEHLMQLSLKHNLKVVECTPNVGGFVYYEQNPDDFFIHDFDDVMGRPVMSGFNNVWNKLYHKEIISGVKFKPNALYEDYLFISEIWSKIKFIGFTPMSYYFYSQDGESIMRSNYDTRKLDGFWGIYEATLVFQKLPKTKKAKEKLRQIFLNILRFHFESLIENQHLDPEKKHLKRMHKIFKENIKLRYTNPYYSIMYILTLNTYIKFYFLNQKRIKLQKRLIKKTS